MCGNTSIGSNTTYYKPEQRISDIISKEAGVYINPQVVKLIVKYNWRELAKAAHEIHDAN
jgi:hypothetical protein